MVSSAALQDAELQGQPKPSWSTSDVLGFIGLGGIYHLHGHFMSHLHAKGIDFVLQRLVFGKNEAVRESRSPTVLIRSNNLASRLPPVLLVHGTSDKIVPQEQSEAFQTVLSAAGTDVQLIFREGEGHNDPVIHSPLMSDHSTVQAILLAMRRWSSSIQPKEEEDADQELFQALPKWPRTPLSALSSGLIYCSEGVYAHSGCSGYPGGTTANPLLRRHLRRK